MSTHFNSADPRKQILSDTHSEAFIDCHPVSCTLTVMDQQS